VRLSDKELDFTANFIDPKTGLSFNVILNDLVIRKNMRRGLNLAIAFGLEPRALTYNITQGN